MSKRVQKPSPQERKAEPQDRASDVERAEEVVRRGEEIEEELDRLDEIIEAALEGECQDGESQEEAARRFTNGFKQEGGE